MFNSYRSCRTAVVAAILLGSATIPGMALADCTPSFRQVNTDGFGSPFNIYSWSMEVFQDRLYVGTFNRTTGGEIWAYDGTQWLQVHQQSLPATGNQGFRSMVLFQGHLYAGSYNIANGAEVWRTADGLDWEQLVAGGFGDVDNKAIRGLAVFQDQLYIGTQHNPGSGGQLWRSADGVAFTPVSTDGLGDPSNSSIHSMAVFNGHLYVGTRNQSTMLQVWRTSDGNGFEQVVGPDAAEPSGFGIPANNTVLSMYVYNGMLYFGSGNFALDGRSVNGFTVYRTADGINYEAINTNGAGDIQNRFAWRFIDFENHLWLGIGNYAVANGKGGQAARSPDGRPTTWQMMVGPGSPYHDYGFDNPMNFGIRSFAVYHDKLYLGTAQCFKSWCAPDVTGTEVWEWSGEACPVSEGRAQGLRRRSAKREGAA